MPHPPARAALALALLGGCARGDTLAGLEVEEATLQGVAVVYAGAILGIEAGGANLHVVTTDDEELDVPVRLVGPRLGLIGGLSVGVSVVDLPLLWVGDVDDSAIPGEDLLGTYAGWQYSGQALLGFRGGALENEAGVQIALALLEIGGGVAVEHAWVTIEEAAEE